MASPSETRRHSLSTEKHKSKRLAHVLPCSLCDGQEGRDECKEVGYMLIKANHVIILEWKKNLQDLRVPKSYFMRLLYIIGNNGCITKKIFTYKIVEQRVCKAN